MAALSVGLKAFDYNALSQTAFVERVHLIAGFNTWIGQDLSGDSVMTKDPWDNGTLYEPFMGRWSRKIASLFLKWLAKPAGLRWLDVGCGTGALSGLIAERHSPAEVLGIDPSDAFISEAVKAAAELDNLKFKVGSVENIPAADGSYDLAVSALALNFFPDPVAGLQEMMRVIHPGGEIAIYVWDYAEGMQMLRYFWDAATALDPSARVLDEAVRFPICRPHVLERIFKEAGLVVNEIRALESPTVFTTFEDYWHPFQGGVGPAPGYLAGLAPEAQKRLANALRSTLPVKTDGTIPLISRAWGISGTK